MLVPRNYQTVIRIRQGDNLTSTLLNVVMDEDVKQSEKLYKMGDKEMKIVCSTDDAVITSEDEDNLQRLLYKFELTVKKITWKYL